MDAERVACAGVPMTEPELLVRIGRAARGTRGEWTAGESDGETAVAQWDGEPRRDPPRRTGAALGEDERSRNM